MATTSIKNGSYSLILDVWQIRQDIVGNRTTFGYHLRLVKNTGSGFWSRYTTFWNVQTPNGHIIAHGSTNGYDFRGANTLTLAHGEHTIGHNADGSLPARAWVGAWSDSDGSIGGYHEVWQHGVTATTIPRATAPQIAGGKLTTGVPASIQLPRAASNFTHDVTYRFGSLTGTIATAAATSATWTPPHSLLSQIPTAAQGDCIITVVTKNGGHVIGSKQTTVTLTAADSVKPTVSAVSFTDDNVTVKNNIGAFVASVSRIRGSINATGVYGSTITGTKYVVAGAEIEPGSVITPTSGGSITAAGVVTDSRGRTGTKTASLQVLPYRAPILEAGGFSVSRANAAGVKDPQGSYLTVTCHVSAAALTVSGVQKNGLTLRIRTKASNAGWINRNTINPGLVNSATPIQVTGGGAFLPSLSYTVEVTITDRTGTQIVLTQNVGTAAVALDLNGTKVGVGKMHEQGALDVAGDVYSNGRKLVPAATLAEALAAASQDRAVTPAGIGALKATNSEAVAGVSAEKFVTPAALHHATVEQPNNSLWAGALQMSAGHRAQLSQPVSAQANGIVLIWGRIDGGRTYDFDFQTNFIPKSFIAGVAYREFTFPVIVGDALGRKVFYVYNDRIEGHQLSGQPGNNYWVLRYVYGF
ncbi:DUF859 family phage minor structural protein [Canibacter oris]|uniref:Uncharacterized protein n=1 Tax=Canibacter oris TaxID=1365628 RepID=A0A840DH36_9MICO|nr:hypothetical protein [Canibacter oris]